MKEELEALLKEWRGWQKDFLQMEKVASLAYHKATYRTKSEMYGRLADQLEQILRKDG